MNIPNISQENTEDWNAEQRRIEMGAERLLRPAPHKFSPFPENTKEDFLGEIERTNVESSEARSNYHE
jgi:hypothetical protein